MSGDLIGKNDRKEIRLAFTHHLQSGIAALGDMPGPLTAVTVRKSLDERELWLFTLPEWSAVGEACGEFAVESNFGVHIGAWARKPEAMRELLAFLNALLEKS